MKRAKTIKIVEDKYVDVATSRKQRSLNAQKRLSDPFGECQNDPFVRLAAGSIVGP